MLTKDQALEKIGKHMGVSKFDNAMQGAMLPSGEIDIGYALSLIYGGSAEMIRKRLRRRMDKEYKACFARQRRRSSRFSK